MAVEWIPKAAVLVASGPRVTTPGIRFAAVINAVMDGMTAVSQAATSGSLDPFGPPASSRLTPPTLQMTRSAFGQGRPAAC